MNTPGAPPRLRPIPPPRPRLECAPAFAPQPLVAAVAAAELAGGLFGLQDLKFWAHFSSSTTWETVRPLLASVGLVAERCQGLGGLIVIRSIK
jgi:hypothetical protein